MAVPLALAGAAIGGIRGLMSGKDAKDDARKTADLKWQAVQEEVRRMELAHTEIISQAGADVGASGFTSSSKSHADTISNAESEFKKSRDQMLTFGKAQRDLDYDAASNIEKQSMLSGLSFGLDIGSSASEWFK